MLRRIYLLLLFAVLLNNQCLCVGSEIEQQEGGRAGACVQHSHRVRVHDPKYDVTFKILFGEETGKDRTIHFLNTVYSLAGERAIADIEFLPTSVPRFKDEDRTLHFDVKLRVCCSPYKGESFIVEMQKARIPALVNRFVFYGATELVESGKLAFEETRSDRSKYYSALKPVHVLTILNFDDESTRAESGNATDKLVWWDITERKSRNKMTNILDWAFLVLPRMPHDMLPHNTLERWIYLLNRNDEEDVEVSSTLTEGDNTPLDHAYQRMSHLTRDEVSALRSSQESARVANDALVGKYEEGRSDGREDTFSAMRRAGLTEEQIRLVRSQMESDAIRSAVDEDDEECDA